MKAHPGINSRAQAHKDIHNLYSCPEYICFFAKDKQFLKICSFWPFWHEILTKSKPTAIRPIIFSPV